MLPRVDKDHIYEELYQSVDTKTKTNNTYDTFFNLKETDLVEANSSEETNDFRLTINVDNTASPSENDPIYIDPADFAKTQGPALEKEITIVNLSNGTISKSLGARILSDMSINDMYKSALSEKLKDKSKSLLKTPAQTRSLVNGNSESSGASTVFSSILKNDGSSTSEEFSFQSHLYKESLRSESGFMRLNERKINDLLEEVIYMNQNKEEEKKNPQVRKGMAFGRIEAINADI